jgi:hypothetical protein
MRTASVLESHDGVNGGLDVSGKFKKRKSDEDLRSTALEEEVEDHLVYIHHVQPSDTYAGIVLKYRCREDAFRKANGLWSRDNIQIRKYVVMPVDACEVRGRPCEAPSGEQRVDLLAPTPDITESSSLDPGASDDFFGWSMNGKSKEQQKPGDDELPWTHVRWVSIDSLAKPVEIARVARRTLGYFPPRRKKSLHTVSTLSTPRGSIDVPSIPIGSELAGSPASNASPRRNSILNPRPQLGNIQGSSSPGGSRSRSRVHSSGDEHKPAWMRRPGGVGSMGKHVRAPGPERDYFNSWAKKHMPGLAIDSLPSMSVMGSESARFSINADEQSGIVESPFAEGHDVLSTSRQGSGLDKAALAVETWLRGAFAKKPGTPILGPRTRLGADEGDLIELTDTNSDDGRGLPREFSDARLLPSSAFGSSARSDGDAMTRERNPGKAKKAD